jgi:flavin reductase (DIM6/NTAB) family NADH-FMN oxidoreductase RutF
MARRASRLSGHVSAKAARTPFIEETKESSATSLELLEAINRIFPLSPRRHAMIHAGLEPTPSRLVKPPRVAPSPCGLECKWLKTVSLNDLDGHVLNNHIVVAPVFTS